MVPKSSLGHKKSDPGVMAISGQYFRLSNFENTSLTEISPHNYQAMGGLFKVLRFQALPPAPSGLTMNPPSKETWSRLEKELHAFSDLDLIFPGVV